MSGPLASLNVVEFTGLGPAPRRSGLPLPAPALDLSGAWRLWGLLLLFVFAVFAIHHQTHH